MTDSSTPEQLARTWARHRALVAAQDWPTACLYVVATPIGNQADLTLRAWHLLNGCDVIAAEDTRTTGVLLSAWGIHTPLLPAHRHNEAQASEAILTRLAVGERVALVSDAGTPAVSDPGARVVRAVQAAGYRVVPLPGASAVLAAIMASGATSDAAPGFIFAGFPPPRSSARRTWLAQQLAATLPVVCFEAPHRLTETLAELAALASPGQRVTVARELTKRFEEIHTLEVAQAPAWLARDRHRTQGECVLVLHAAATRARTESTGLDPEQTRLMTVLLEELSVRDAVRIAARLTEVPRDRLYAWALAHKS